MRRRHVKDVANRNIRCALRCGETAQALCAQSFREWNVALQASASQPQPRQRLLDSQASLRIACRSGQRRCGSLDQQSLAPRVGAGEAANSQGPPPLRRDRLSMRVDLTAIGSALDAAADAGWLANNPTTALNRCRSGWSGWCCLNKFDGAGLPRGSTARCGACENSLAGPAFG